MQAEGSAEQRLPLVQQELERVKEELREAGAARAEAEQLGDAALVAEVAGMEDQLKVVAHELQGEVDRLKAEQLASSGSALRARLAKMRDSEARARSLLVANSGSLKQGSSGLSLANSASFHSQPSAEPSPAKPSGLSSPAEPSSSLAPHAASLGKPPSPSRSRPSPSPADLHAAPPGSMLASPQQTQSLASSPEPQAYDWSRGYTFKRPPEADSPFGEQDAFAAQPAFQGTSSWAPQEQPATQPPAGSSSFQSSSSQPRSSSPQRLPGSQPSSPERKPAMEGDDLFHSVGSGQRLDKRKLSEDAQEAATSVWLQGASFEPAHSSGGLFEPRGSQSTAFPASTAPAPGSWHQPQQEPARGSSSPSRAPQPSSPAQPAAADAWGAFPEAGRAPSASAPDRDPFGDAWGGGAFSSQPKQQQQQQQSPLQSQRRSSADLWGFEAGEASRPTQSMAAPQSAEQPASPAVSASRAGSAPGPASVWGGAAESAPGATDQSSPGRPRSGVKLPAAEAGAIPASPFAGASRAQPPDQQGQSGSWASFSGQEAGPETQSSSRMEPQSSTRSAQSFGRPPKPQGSYPAPPQQHASAGSQGAQMEPTWSTGSGNPFLDYHGSGALANAPAQAPRAESPVPGVGDEPSAEGSGFSASWPGLAPPGDNGLPAGNAGWAAWDTEEHKPGQRQAGPPKVVIQPTEGQDASWASFAADVPQGPVPRGPLGTPQDSRGTSPSRDPGFADDWDSDTSQSQQSVDLGRGQQQQQQQQQQRASPGQPPRQSPPQQPRGNDLISFDSNAGQLAQPQNDAFHTKGLGSRLTSLRQQSAKLGSRMRTASSRFRSSKEESLSHAPDNPFGATGMTNQLSEAGPSWGLSNLDPSMQGSQQVPDFDPFDPAAGPAQPADLEALAGWDPITPAERVKCEAAFHSKGFDAEGGLEPEAAAELHRKSRAPPETRDTTFSLADVDQDGVLDLREFCLFMTLLKGLRKDPVPELPATLSPAQAAHLLGEAPPPTKVPAILMPASSTGSWVDIPPGEDPAGPVGGQQQAMQGQRSLKARGKGMISMLGRKMQKEDPLKELTALGYHEDDCRRALFLHANDVKVAREWLSERFGPPSSQPAPGTVDSPRGSPGSSPSRAAPRGFEFRPDPTTPHAAGTGQYLRIRLEKADVVHYKKPVERPLFHVSLLDGAGRSVEASLVTPPCAFDAGIIRSDHTVALRTKAGDIPEGAALYFEVRHWKAQEKKFSTLGWSYMPVEVLLDSGSSPHNFGASIRAARVRTGPVYMNLYAKPVDEKAHVRLLHQTVGAGVGKRGPKPLNLRNHDLFVHISAA